MELEDSFATAPVLTTLGPDALRLQIELPGRLPLERTVSSCPRTTQVLSTEPFMEPFYTRANATFQGHSTVRVSFTTVGPLALCPPTASKPALGTLPIVLSVIDLP